MSTIAHVVWGLVGERIRDVPIWPGPSLKPICRQQVFLRLVDLGWVHRYKKLILSDFIHCQWFQLPPSTDDTQILDLAWISKALAPSLDNYLPCLEDTATQSLNGFRSQQVTSVLVALCYWQHLYLYLWSDYGLCRESPLCSCSSCFYSDDARNASGWVLGASRDMSKARMTSPGVTCGRQRWAWEKRENELKPSRS